jgi:hypothetical protein
VEFSAVAQLRDALLASYPAAAWYGAPVVGVNRDDPAPAWGWLVKLLRTRTDWWPAVGVALQHAAQDGGDLARIALADFLDSYSESVVLLDWTAPIADRWPDVRAGLSLVTFGHPDHRLATIIAGQRAFWESQQGTEVSVERLGPGGRYLNVDVKTAADLEAVLARSAKAGKPWGAAGPWTWLLDELLFRHWMRPLLPAACARFGTGTDAEVRAALAWLVGEHDLWRYVDLLDGWRLRPPAWWDEPADTRPRGWRYPFRQWNVPGAKTLGEVALGYLYRAQGQAATHPVADLAPIPSG